VEPRSADHGDVTPKPSLHEDESRRSEGQSRPPALCSAPEHQRVVECRARVSSSPLAHPGLVVHQGFFEHGAAFR
jgi:hypothetical protein